MEQKRVLRGFGLVFMAAGLLLAPARGYPQTQAQERRANRLEARDGNDVGRDDARAAKAACLAGDEKTRPECRKEKRDANAGADDTTHDTTNGE